MQEIEADGQLVFPSENRRAEAVFSAFKHMARKYDALMVEKQVDVAMAKEGFHIDIRAYSSLFENHHSEIHLKINHLAQWAYAQDDNEMLRMMHEARTNRKAVWSDRSARKKLFDREIYDRLFLND